MPEINVDIHQFKGHDLSGGTLIVSVPGPGIGNILFTDLLLEENGMDHVAALDSEGFPPVAMMHEGKARYPVRIHADPDTKVAVLRSEFQTTHPLARPLGNAILECAEELDVDRIVVVDGVQGASSNGAESSDEEPPKLVFAASQSETVPQAEQAGIEEFGQGAIGGTPAILILEGRRRGLDVLLLLAVLEDRMDDVHSIQSFAEVLPSFVDDLQIDKDALERKMEKNEEAVRGLQKQAQKALQHMHGATQRPDEPAQTSQPAMHV